MKQSAKAKIKSSFRDPAGFVYRQNGRIFRQINDVGRQDYDLFIKSGLYQKLVFDGLMISHREKHQKLPSGIYKIIEPQMAPFISYPYEWCFSQLKDAALVTLQIQKESLKRGLSLKDASAYNIQFMAGKPVMIDTLSFEKYRKGQPWVAYRQFCQHFLAPLALISLVDLKSGLLSRIFLDGVPLDFACKLLPFKTRLSLGLATHLHLHAKSQQNHLNQKPSDRNSRFSLPKPRLLAIIESLESTVKSLKFPKQATIWQDYYQNTNYSSKSFQQKKQLVSRLIKQIKPKTVWDAGANDGYFSRLASGQGVLTIATDFDFWAVEQAYLKAKKQKDQFILPLILDLTNPSPDLGWQNRERDSFLRRGKFDLTLCLALMHHLSISNNLPFEFQAKMWAGQTENLIIEFVPKDDSNAQRLLSGREDIFDNYNQQAFESAFSVHFLIQGRYRLAGSKRCLYRMKRKG